MLGQNVNSYGRDLPRRQRITFAELLAQPRCDRRHRPDPLHEPASQGHARGRDPRPRRAALAVRAHPPPAAVRVELGAQADAPDLHARALPRPRRDDPRARPGLRADHRHHRRLPGRERGRLRADTRAGRGRSATTARSRSSTRRGGGPKPRRSPTRCRTSVKVAADGAAGRGVQRRALERAQRFVGRTHERARRRVRRGPIRAACAVAPATTRSSTSPASPHLGSWSRSRSPRATSQTLSGEESILARAAG